MNVDNKTTQEEEKALIEHSLITAARRYEELVGRERAENFIHNLPLPW